MNKLVIIFGVALLSAVLVASALAGPGWRRGWGGGSMMGYGGGPGSCWNQAPAGDYSRERFREPQPRQNPPGYQGQYGPNFGPRHMGPGWGMNMMPPYGGRFGWGN